MLPADAAEHRLACENPSYDFTCIIDGEESDFWEANEIVDVFGSYQISDGLAVGFSVENVANTYYNPPLFVTLFPSPGRTARMNLTMAF